MSEPWMPPRMLIFGAVIGLLLILELLGLAGLGAYEFLQVNWQRSWEHSCWNVSQRL